MFGSYFVWKLLCLRSYFILKLLCLEATLFRSYFVWKLLYLEAILYNKLLCLEATLFGSYFIWKLLYLKIALFKSYFVWKLLCLEATLYKKLLIWPPFYGSYFLASNFKAAILRKDKSEFQIKKAQCDRNTIFRQQCCSSKFLHSCLWFSYSELALDNIPNYPPNYPPTPRYVIRTRLFKYMIDF